MVTAMATQIDELQILDPVVVAVTVDVMHMLVG